LSVTSSSSSHGPSYLRALFIPVRKTSTRAVRSLSISGPLGLPPPPAPLDCSSGYASSPTRSSSNSRLRRKQSSPSVLPSLSPPRPASPIPRVPPAAQVHEPELDAKGRPLRQHRTRPPPASPLDDPLSPPPSTVAPAAARKALDANMTTSASNHMMKNSKRGRPYIKVRRAQSLTIKGSTRKGGPFDDDGGGFSSRHPLMDDDADELACASRVVRISTTSSRP
jgi:hypothetical protein